VTGAARHWLTARPSPSVGPDLKAISGRYQRNVRTRCAWPGKHRGSGSPRRHAGRGPV